MAKAEPRLKEKVAHYHKLTEAALKKVFLKKNLQEKEKTIALDFLEMANNYFSDAKHFEQKKDFATALAAFSYAHAWLDAGVRAGLFDAQGDDKLFTLPKSARAEKQF